MGDDSTYTIAQAAELTGLHRNTIRQKIRLGQLRAETRPGKYGDEYRIARAALAAAGLLPGEAPPAEEPAAAPPEPEVLSVEATPADGAEPPAGETRAAGAGGTAALAELFQRHEQAMFRLGYLQGELERVKALADSAESLRERTEESERQAAQLRQQLDAARREAEEARRLREELENARRQAQEAEALRGQVGQMTEQLERLRQEAELARRPWWRRWGRRSG